MRSGRLLAQSKPNDLIRAFNVTVSAEGQKCLTMSWYFVVLSCLAMFGQTMSVYRATNGYLHSKNLFSVPAGITNVASMK